MAAKGAMWLAYFNAERGSDLSLQTQLREAIVRGIVDQRLPPGAALPSTRHLATLLGMGRNTVLHAYELLVQDGYLRTVPRQGHVVNPGLRLEHVRSLRPLPERAVTEPVGVPPDWAQRLPRGRRSGAFIARPRDWRGYPYPFVHGQIDTTLFPMRDWREAVLTTCTARSAASWVADIGDGDDPLFVEQIRTQLLPRRGIWASEDQILVTLGAQHALWLVAQVLCNRSTVVGVEEVSYPDARNIFADRGAQLVDFALDAQGLVPTRRLADCHYLYVAPSHQNPTNANMPLARRMELLRQATEHDVVVIEDDYDSELTFEGKANPAIKSLDDCNRVIHVGSLSKTLAPGIRVGFMVAAPEFIQAARVVRQRMMRHAPTNNQRAVGHFVALGHHERYMARLVEVFRERVGIACAALQQQLPELRFAVPSGGSSLWIEAPAGVNMALVEMQAKAHGLLFDAGGRFSARQGALANCFRLGLSAIDTRAIEPGITLLASLIQARR